MNKYLQFNRLNKYTILSFVQNKQNIDIKVEQFDLKMFRLNMKTKKKKNKKQKKTKNYPHLIMRQAKIAHILKLTLKVKTKV